MSSPPDDRPLRSTLVDARDGRHLRLPISGPDRPVDHDRTPGLPPPSADDDYEDMVDITGAESFPASDPPSSW